MAEKHRDTDNAEKTDTRKQRTDIDFTTTGDGTAWDSGRTSSITRGSQVEKDLREGDAESPGVTGPKPNRDSE